MRKFFSYKTNVVSFILWSWWFWFYQMLCGKGLAKGKYLKYKKEDMWIEC